MNTKEVVLAVAIAVLTIFVAVYGINTFYPRPVYDDFCDDVKSVLVETHEDCDFIGGNWNYYEKINAKENVESQSDGYCDRDYYCRKEYDSARDKWMRNVFFIGLPLGILIILLGMFIFGLDFVGAGLMWGGLATIIYSAWGFFWETADWVRFIISLVALAVLIWVAYRSNKGAIKKDANKKVKKKFASKKK